MGEEGGLVVGGHAGLVVGGEVCYLIAPEWKGWVALSWKGHWTSNKGRGGDNCFIEVEMGIMPHLGWKGFCDHGHPFPFSLWKKVRVWGHCLLGKGSGSHHCHINLTSQMMQDAHIVPLPFWKSQLGLPTHYQTNVPSQTTPAPLPIRRFLTITLPTHCWGRDIGLVEGWEVLYLTASKRGGVLDLCGKRHWTGSE